MSVDASVDDPQYHLTDHAMPFSYFVRHTSTLGERGGPRKPHSPARIISVRVSRTCGVALPEMLIQQTR